MGFFDDVFGGVGDVISTVVDPITGALTGRKKQEQQLSEYQRQLEDQRNKAKQAQYGLLGQMQGPQVSPYAEKRLKALEAESAPTSLVEDPLFQGDRATLVQGGQQALARVDNTQRAQDTSGGFANQGSMSDIYDRLGSQLSQLGQQSRAVKEQKRDVVAQGRQAIADAQIAYQNSITQAKMAIESGDSAAASAALQQAYAAKQAMDAAQLKMTGALVGGATSALTGVPSSNPMGQQAQPDPWTSQQMALINQGAYSGSLQQPNLGQTQNNMPYSSMRNR